MNKNEVNTQEGGKVSPANRPPVRLPALMRAEEVAQLLNIGTRTMWRWVSAGKIPPPDFREGQTVRWLPATIEAWLHEKCRGDRRR